MKLKFTFVLILAISVFIISCSKSSDKHSNPIVGTWTGYHTIKNQPTREDLGILTYSFTIKADSSIAMQELGNDGNTYFYNGTWTLNGTDFKAFVSGAAGLTLSLTATYSDDKGTLSSGDWENPNGSGGGTFEMTRTN